MMMQSRLTLQSVSEEIFKDSKTSQTQTSILIELQQLDKSLLILQNLLKESLLLKLRLEEERKKALLRICSMVMKSMINLPLSRISS